MPRFQDIPQFTRSAPYAVDISWEYLHLHYTRAIVEDQLDINPDFQRAYVWTPEQKVRYIEFILQGGMTGRDLYLNCPGWRMGRVGRNYPEGWYVLVDGKQRLDAVLGFLNNEVPIFGGHYRRDYTDHPDMLKANFKWHVNDLETYPEVLQWYIDLNAGGTIHTDEEINRVKGLILGKPEYQAPSPEEIQAQSRLDREPIQKALQEFEADRARLRAQAEAQAVLKATKGKKGQRK